MDYRQAGVDIDAGNEAVRRIKALATSTFTPQVLSEIGSFGGLFRFDPSPCRDPVLVASADGVGTKLRVALMAGRHDTVGIDLVNHCVNDILVQGAEPLFFLDYLATARLNPAIVEEIVAGIATACRGNRCVLLGGETAEMPGFYADGDYDLAGFIVGVVGRDRLVDGRGVRPGDRVLGLASSGLHTNGFSLARRIVFDELALTIQSSVAALGATVGDVLLQPHRSYLPILRELLGFRLLKGMAHITGGGMTENLPRILPEGCAVEIDRRTWTVPPVFDFLQKEGKIADDEMFRTFNMGIGMILLCADGDAERAMQELARAGEAGARVIGRVVEGERTVSYV